MSSRRAVVRILDANVNRAREGLRVCEDLARFSLGSPRHVRALRTLRHRLSAQVTRLPVDSVELVRARNSQHDTGRRFRAASAKSLEHLLLINLQRTKEAVRVLEESSRLIAPRLTPAFQRLRFQTYDAERRLLIHVATLRHRRRWNRGNS